MKNLLNYINSLTEFSEQSWSLLQPALSERTYKKNEFLLEEGQICNSLFYVEKGYCKSYYNIDGACKNTGFFFENEIVTNLKSFGSEEKSMFHIVACELLNVTVFDKKKLFQAAQQASEIETLGINCIRRFASLQLHNLITKTNQKPVNRMIYRLFYF